MKKSDHWTQLPKRIAVGVAAAVLTTVVGAMLCGAMLQREVLGESQIPLLAMGVLLVSSMTGSLLSCSIGEGKILICAGGTGLLYWGCLLAVHGALYPTGYQNVGVTALLILGVGLAGGLLRIYALGRSDGRKRKRRSR